MLKKKIKRDKKEFSRFLEPPFEVKPVGHFQGWETDPEGDLPPVFSSTATSSSPQQKMKPC